MNSMRTRIASWILLAISPSSYLSAAVERAEPAELQPLTLGEARAAYQESGQIENFQCVHVLVGDDNKVGRNPLAVEFDEKIYLRIDGVLVGLERVESGNLHSSYLSRTTKVDVYVLRVTKTSEYGESSNRLMLLNVKTAGRTFSVKTFGAACGI